jgi:meso-butanediol dehydrogenase / (S,S)-butanediol dehydrogenase / diacetyl reductase
MPNTVLITGSTSGIGLAVGHNAIVASRSTAKVEATVKEINDAGNKAVGYTLNLNSLADVNSFLAKFTEEVLELDVLVLNAGVQCKPWSC